MDSKHTGSLLLMLTWLVSGACVFVEQPGEVYEILGKPLYIPCVTDTDIDYVNWQADISGTVTTIGDTDNGINIAYQQYYKLESGHTPARNFTLKIPNVRLGEPQLRCDVEVPVGPPVKSSWSVITVGAAPYAGYPTCSMSETSINDGSSLTLTCNSAGGVEPAALKWKDGDTVLNEGPGTAGTESNGRGNRILEHTFTVYKRDDGKKFTCTAQNTAITLLHDRGNLTTDMLTCTTQTINVTYPPEVTTIEPAGSHIITEGNAVTVKCAASGGNPDVYKYIFRQPTKKWSGWSSTDTKGYSRRNRNQAGEYSCQSQNSAGDGPVQTFELVIHFAPVIETQPSHTTVQYTDDDFEMMCTYEAKPPADIIWQYSNGSTLPTNVFSWNSESVTEDTYTSTESKLIWNSESDATKRRNKDGEANCVATNAIGTSKSGDRTLSIEYGPYTVTLSSGDVVKKEDEDQSDIICSSDCKPDCTFKWLFGDGNEVSNTATLKLGRLKRAEQGTYTCEAHNKHDTVTQSLDVTVYYPPVVSNFEITGGTIPGGQVILTCTGDSRPLTSVQIFNGTNRLTEESAEDTVGYTIAKVDCLDSGTFQCVVTNDKYEDPGTAEEELMAHCPPRILKTVPDPPKTAGGKGKQVEPLVVAVIAYPYPEFKWQQLNSNSDLEIPRTGLVVDNTTLTSTLTIHSITQEQFGNYSLTATNSHGDISVIFEVTSESTPDSPNNLNLTVTAVSLTVQWDRGWNGGPDQVFHMDYYGGSKQFDDTTVHYSVRLDEDDGIAESTKYAVSLYAQNSIGLSPTITETVTTKAKPRVDTEKTKIQVNQNNTATITWAVSNRESFTRIVVRVCAVNTYDCLEHTVTESDASGTLVVDVPDGENHHVFFYMYDGLDLVSSHDVKLQTGEGGDDITIMGVVIGVIALLAVVLVVVIFIVRYRRRHSDKGVDDIRNQRTDDERGRHFRRKPRNREDIDNTAAVTPESTAAIYERTNPVYVNRHMEASEYAGLRPVQGVGQQEVVYEEVESKVVDCTPNAIQLNSLLHRGTFCDVHIGTAKQLRGLKSGTIVVGKKNKEGLSPFEQPFLLNEIKALRAVGTHRNIVQPLALCIHHEPMMAILKLEENGNLKTYLPKRKEETYANEDPRQTLANMTLDVAKGMAYLAQLKPEFLHQSLNAGHVLVSKDVVCRVTGFGFAENVLEREDHERTKGQAIRWMAPEQLARNEHTKMSDVWSFGVLMWEIYSYGTTPYADMTTYDVKQCILTGGMLGCPGNTPDGVFDIMLDCWKVDVDQRPSFGTLLNKLTGDAPP